MGIAAHDLLTSGRVTLPCNVCIKGFNSFYGNRQNQNSDNKIDLEDDGGGSLQ